MAGLLPAVAVEQLTAEAGWPRLVRDAESAEHNSDTVLGSAIEVRSLGDAEQVSDVLRVGEGLAADRTPEGHVALGDWTSLAHRNLGV